MREIRYNLTADAIGTDGNAVSKIASVEDLIIDTGMLITNEYEKIIPNVSELNKLLNSGSVLGIGEWEPFVISDGEYKEIVESLISLPIPRPFRVELILKNSVFKEILKQIAVNILVIVVFVLIGTVVPVFLNFEFVGAILFSWVLAPVVTIFVVHYVLEKIKVGNVKRLLVISFVLNFVYVLIYTWIDSYRPNIQGDFMDFRGIEFLVFGASSIIGVVFSSIYFDVLKGMRVQNKL